MRYWIIACLILMVNGIAAAQNTGTALFDNEDGQIYWQELTPQVDYTQIYGSQYRKALSKKSWGVALTTLAAPLAALVGVVGISNEDSVAAAAGIGGAVACAVPGIKLWVKGQRELDWMMDDYARRYGPKPYASSLTVGTNQNGWGLAFNF